MSIQAVARVLDSNIVQVAAKMLMVCLANSHNSSTGLCCPSIERLALESSMGVSTVRRWLAWLAREKLIEVKPANDRNGRQLTNNYVLFPQPSLPSQTGTLPNWDPPACDTPLKEPEDKNKRKADRPIPIDALTAVLDHEHAEAIIEHRIGLGAPLTAASAALLATELDAWPDPNEAAEAMMLNGWKTITKSYRPLSTSDRRVRGDRSQAADETGKRPALRLAASAKPDDYETVRPAEDRALFGRCVAAMRDQTGEDWGWKIEHRAVSFPVAVTSAARGKTMPP